MVGRNGSGKSTLLQLIAGTVQPSRGSVRTRGRVAALLELGSGFNPEFTGRENVYLNAATLGLSKRQIDERLDAIIEFSGVGAHIDQPVKTYSSGMYVRLAFSIATSADPDVLIVDEALSVGDGAFARRSFDRIMQIKDRGAAVLFCSHALFHVEVFCNQALWLHQGRVQDLGPVSRVLGRYQEFLDGMADGPMKHAQGEGGSAFVEALAHGAGAGPGDGAAVQESGGAAHPAPPAGDAASSAGNSAPSASGAARIRAVRVRLGEHQGDELYGEAGQSTLCVEIDFDSDPALPAVSAAVVLSSEGGRILASHLSLESGEPLARDAQGRGTARVTLERVPLNKGRYRVGAYLLCERGFHVYQWVDPVAHLNLHGDRAMPGYFLLDARWRGDGPAPDAASRAAGHWDRWQAARDAQRPRMTDWGDHPEVLRLIGAELLGSADTSIVAFLAGRLGARQAHALSLCCGDGGFEKALLAGGVFRSIEGLDLSEVRIEAARAAAGEHQGRLSFRACDIDAAEFGEAVCDAVLAKAALHHLGRLEDVFDGIARCLRPGGVLVTLDFFGPTRFQWTDRQLDEANRFLETEVPEELRLLPGGSLYRATRPTVQEMIEMDPSEAIRSSDILPLLRERFETELDLPLGGTLLNLILHGSIVDNFEPGNAAHDEIVRKAFALERRLMAEGAIGSDFRLIIARPKPAPTR
ncbi:MAG: ATP-binding cassette domain-containing protein [Gammaproteobacteria bacterium]